MCDITKIISKLPDTCKADTIDFIDKRVKLKTGKYVVGTLVVLDRLMTEQEQAYCRENQLSYAILEYRYAPEIKHHAILVR